MNDIPRRNRLDLNTPAELAIRDAMLAVENAGAHPLLTDAVVLLGHAREKVADYVDRPVEGAVVETEGREKPTNRYAGYKPEHGCETEHPEGYCDCACNSCYSVDPITPDKPTEGETK